MRNTLLISLMIAAGLAASSAKACGDGMLMAILFLKHPEAKTVYEAAQRFDGIGIPAYSAASSEQHAVSLLQTKLATHMLKRRFTRIAEPDGSDNAVSIFLAEEGQLIALGFDQDGLVTMADVNIYTTAAALRTLLAGRTSLDQALHSNLVLLTGDQIQQSKTEQLIREVFANPDS